MITTKEALLNELDRMTSCYDDDIMFCLTEYKNIMPLDDIAMYLVRAFKNRVWMYADELIKEMEENDN